MLLHGFRLNLLVHCRHSEGLRRQGWTKFKASSNHWRLDCKNKQDQFRKAISWQVRKKKDTSRYWKRKQVIFVYQRFRYKLAEIPINAKLNFATQERVTAAKLKGIEVNKVHISNGCTHCPTNQALFVYKKMFYFRSRIPWLQYLTCLSFLASRFSYGSRSRT